MGSCLSKPAVATPGVDQTGVADTQVHAPQCEASKVVAAPGDDAQAKARQRPAMNGNEAPAGPVPYTGAIAPVCELQRRQHLLDLNILYTEPEQRFDDITKLCSMVFKVPIALVSLVDEKVQWFKSVVGLPGVDNTPRPTSFCAWTLLPAYPEALVVEDAQRDARFKDNPLVTGAPHIRFYAGCPLVCSNGMRLGSLCIIDKEPRVFDAESCNMLANMAEMVVREIEKDKALEEQRLRQQQQHSERKKLLRALDCFSDAIMLVDTSDDSWNIVFSNEAWEGMMGQKRQPNMGFWTVFQQPAASSAGPTNHGQDYRDAIAKQRNFELMVTYHNPRQQYDGYSAAGAQQYSAQRSSRDTPRHYAIAQFRCAANTGLDKHMPLIGIPNFLPNTAEGNKSFYFVTLKEVPPPASSAVSTSNSSTTSSQQVQVQLRRPPRRMASFSLMASDEPFADIRLGPLLGKGAFGRVYRGTWNGKMVSVKVIEYTQQQNQDGELLEGLLSEQVQHPHVVRTYKHCTRPIPMSGSMAVDDETQDMGSSCSANGLPSETTRGQMMETWLVQEFCNRGCVSEAIGKGWFRQKGSATGGLQTDMPTVVATAREMAGALAYLHSKNILHGDLTGNNVLLTVTAGDRRGFMAKVSDFGLSRLISNEAPVIETRTYGTVTHMPAELLIEGKMSKAADVYSFGVVLWEMFTGRPPYPGMSHSQVLHCVSMGKILKLPDTAPPEFATLVSSCLARNPLDRPTFSEVVQQLTAMESQMQL